MESIISTSNLELEDNPVQADTGYYTITQDCMSSSITRMEEHNLNQNGSRTRLLPGMARHHSIDDESKGAPPGPTLCGAIVSCVRLFCRARENILNGMGIIKNVENSTFESSVAQLKRIIIMTMDGCYPCAIIRRLYSTLTECQPEKFSHILFGTVKNLSVFDEIYRLGDEESLLSERENNMWRKRTAGPLF